MTLNEQSLVVHLYSSLTSVPGHDALHGLRLLWDRLPTALGMEHPAHRTSLPEQLQAVELPASGAVAARRDLEGSAQAILRRHGDLLVVSIALSGQSWTELERRWEAVAGDIQGWAWGEARLFVTYADHDSITAEQLIQELPDLPDNSPTRLLEPVMSDRPRATLWEVAGDDDRQLRRLVVVTSLADDLPERLERWLWYERTTDVPLFARYLSHAAKVRYQIRVLAAAPNRETTQLVDDAFHTMRQDLAPPDLPDDLARRARELTLMRHHLLMAVSGPSGLTQQLIDRRELQRTVDIATSNMEASFPEVGLLPDDRAAVRWIGDRLSDAIAYLELDRERLRDLLTALSIQAEATLQYERENQQRREAALAAKQQRINLLQTALIGAFLMLLAAMQTFGYKLPFVPPPAVPALIALLSALALWLSTLVVPLLSPGSHRWQIRFGGACGGLVVAAVGWLATTLWSVHTDGRPAPTTMTLLVTAVSFVLGWSAMARAAGAYRRRNAQQPARQQA
ncbi:CATRA conflict system CASPASE/TPR repeat-associated protein [Streptomyces sp. NPDC056921]|uniref:CATRA conflict system CASPASE/TPR repeat-associated protein n=1 Tax=Streptomyces sp. NPDC056921 TaxID=3345966 RepID=UPI00362F2CDB